MRGVQLQHAVMLSLAGIWNTAQMLEAGCTASLRAELAEQTGVPLEVIRELVSVGDLTRIEQLGKGVARLLVDSGIGSLRCILAGDPQEMARRVRAQNEQDISMRLPPDEDDFRGYQQKAAELVLLLDF